jgi:hypothetical protein
VLVRRSSISRFAAISPRPTRSPNALIRLTSSAFSLSVRASRRPCSAWFALRLRVITLMTRLETSASDATVTVKRFPHAGVSCHAAMLVLTPGHPTETTQAVPPARPPRRAVSSEVPLHVAGDRRWRSARNPCLRRTTAHPSTPGIGRSFAYLPLRASPSAAGHKGRTQRDRQRIGSGNAAAVQK